MGRSTDGILAFGIDLGEEAYFLDDFDHDWEEFLDAMGDYPKWGQPGYSYENRKAFEEKLGVTLVRYCSYEYPMYILAVHGTDHSASRGFTEEISPEDMKISEAQIQKLKDFWYTYIEIDKPDDDENDYSEQPEWSEPKWLLASMWG